MTERPILMSGPMVRALLAGAKTQTRRIAKLPGEPLVVSEGAPEVEQRDGTIEPGPDVFAAWGDDWHVPCPYGRPGDRLWVKETWGHRGSGWSNQKPEVQEVFVTYRADEQKQAILRPVGDNSGLPRSRCLPRFRKGHESTVEHSTVEHYGECLTAHWKRWMPSIHMPRWASRITLEVTGVRVEQLQDISEADANAEGVDSLNASSSLWRGSASMAGCARAGYADAPRNTYDWTARDCFRLLWGSINGADSWQANPWVWVVSFKRVTP